MKSIKKYYEYPTAVVFPVNADIYCASKEEFGEFKDAEDLGEEF